MSEAYLEPKSDSPGAAGNWLRIVLLSVALPLPFLVFCSVVAFGLHLALLKFVFLPGDWLALTVDPFLPSPTGVEGLRGFGLFLLTPLMNWIFYSVVFFLAFALVPKFRRFWE